MTKTHRPPQTADVYFNRRSRLWIARWRTVMGHMHAQYFTTKAEAEDFARETSNYTLAESQRVLSGPRSVMFTREDVLNYRRHET